MNVGVPRSLAGNCLPNRGRLFRSPTDSELVCVNTWYNFHSARKNGKRKGETTESANEEIFYIMKQREDAYFSPQLCSAMTNGENVGEWKRSRTFRAGHYFPNESSGSMVEKPMSLFGAR